jgi:MarR family multiple antibiotic resistance transcriptional regulator
MQVDRGSMVALEDHDEDNRLYHLFAHARYLTFRAREKELQRYHLSPEQSQLLAVAQALNNKATPSEIARYMIREPHSVSSLVNRMVEKGLVKKVQDLDKKNLVRVALTKKGQEAYELTTKRGPIHRILGALNERERKTFTASLEKIIEKARGELGLDRDTLPSSD